MSVQRGKTRALRMRLSFARAGITVEMAQLLWPLLPAGFLPAVLNPVLSAKLSPNLPLTHVLHDPPSNCSGGVLHLLPVLLLPPPPGPRR